MWDFNEKNRVAYGREKHRTISAAERIASLRAVIATGIGSTG
jgi:hypothetical protein